MTRKEILDEALKCVNGDRDHQYGSPENNFALIARLWNAYLGAETYPNPLIMPKDVAAMLAMLKIARIATGQDKADNWIDLAGYAACGGEITTKPHSESFDETNTGCGADYCELDLDDDDEGYSSVDVKIPVKPQEISIGNTVPRQFE